jgi:hypothetical protein
MKSRMPHRYLIVVLAAHAACLGGEPLEPVEAPLAQRGELQFTDAEKQAHLAHVAEIAEQASGCLERTWSDHLAFFARWGVSRYYGVRNPQLDTPAERATALRQAGAPAALLDELQATSCIGLAMQCLEEGFLSVTDPAVESAWRKLRRHVRARDTRGTDLLDALQAIGWRIYYWNPAPDSNERWDAEDRRLDPDNSSRVWGYHAQRYETVMSRGLYYRNRVDDRDLLVGFGTEPPEEFARSPFFVGIAHTGYHVFPGFRGQVIEAHSTRALTSRDNLQNSPFNPLAAGGGPRWTRTERYRSGLIAVPPGSFD